MSRRPRKAGLFLGYWFTLEGKRIRRVRRADLAEAYRLLAKHRDIARGALSGREPQAQPLIHQRTRLDVRASSRPLSARPTFSDDPQ